jgi:membrane-associated phospholipid phosphatase
MDMNGGRRRNYQSNEAAIVWGPEAERLGIAALIAREFAAARAACKTFEWIALGYLGLSCALIAMFAENLAHPIRLIGLQSFVALLIFALCLIEARSFESAGWKVVARSRTAKSGCPTFAQKFWHFWRHWYPHLFFLFCFEELGKLVHLVNPGWEDAKLIAFDRWLTGVNPSLWFEHLAHPGLTEFMEFAYFTYFVYLLILGGILYCQRDLESYWAVMSYSAIAYVFGYVIAILFPVQSPWFAMAGMWHSELAGGPFTALINLIEKCGRVHGAAFPSQHVAGAMAALWGAWRHRRWLFWVFLPFVTCMCVSTVYVRNHYVADVLGGLVTGTLGCMIGSWVIRKRGAAVAETA